MTVLPRVIPALWSREWLLAIWAEQSWYSCAHAAPFLPPLPKKPNPLGIQPGARGRSARAATAEATAAVRTSSARAEMQRCLCVQPGRAPRGWQRAPQGWQQPGGGKRDSEGLRKGLGCFREEQCRDTRLAFWGLCTGAAGG